MRQLELLLQSRNDGTGKKVDDDGNVSIETSRVSFDSIARDIGETRGIK